MGKHVYMDAWENRLEVLTPNGDTFNVMIDNLGRPGLTPETHTFASMLVQKDDARLFIANLAKAMDVEVEFPVTWTEIESPAVSVDYDEEDKAYTVSGDLHDFLSEQEMLAVDERGKALGIETRLNDHASRSVNAIVADIAAVRLPHLDMEYDPEYSCFFAYTLSQPHAEELVRWLNEKEFLK